jgi:hypothetical protein
MDFTDLIKHRWHIAAGLFSSFALLSFCSAAKIYELENKEPEIVIKEVPKIELKEIPCPSPPPTPECTPPPPPPFNVSVAEKRWATDGRYQVSYQIEIPADGEWHDSRILVSSGVKMIWNYDYGNSGGLSVRIGNLQYTTYLPLDYEKSYYEHVFINRKDDEAYKKNEVVLESTRSVEFKAFEKDLVIRVELWAQ